MSCQPLPSLNLGKTTSLAVRNFSVEARNIQEEIGAIVKKEKVVVFMKVSIPNPYKYCIVITIFIF